MATRTRSSGNAKPTGARREPQRSTSFFRRPVARWLAIGLAVFGVAGAASVAYLTRGPRDVTVDQAVESYRSHRGSATSADPATAPNAERSTRAQEGSASTAARPDAPARATAPDAEHKASRGLPPIDEGVYVFATQGYEETDALAGSRHDYPKETSMTVRTTECGWVSRWQPLDERWEETNACDVAEGARMDRYSMYHEFFQRGQREDFECGGFVQKVAAKPGDSWTFSCRSDRSTATSKTTTVGFEDVNVGGRIVRTVHMRYEIVTKGSNRGTLVQDRWLSNYPRRMVRMTQQADLVTDSPFGPVRYREAFRIDLKSLAPRR